MNINGNNIEAIIFDLGGVILNIDINGTFEKLKSFGIGIGKNGFDDMINQNVFYKFELGELSPDLFRNEIRKISNNDFTNTEFDTIWNSMILNYPEENISFLEKIKSKYRTFLMSNTNQIHYEFYSKTLFDGFGYKNLDELFEKPYYSHISGMRKPNVEFFNFIINENGLKPSHTLFIDDFAENIEAAMHVGLKTFHLTDGKKISDLNFD